METENTNNVCSCCENGSCTPSAVPEGDCDFWKSPQYGYSVRASWTDYVDRQRSILSTDVVPVSSNLGDLGQFNCYGKLNDHVYLAFPYNGIWRMENEQLVPTNISNGLFYNTAIFDDTLFFLGDNGLYYLDLADQLFKKADSPRGEFMVWAKAVGERLFLVGHSSVWYLESLNGECRQVHPPIEDDTFQVYNIEEAGGTIWLMGDKVWSMAPDGCLKELFFETDGHSFSSIQGVAELNDVLYFYGWNIWRMGVNDSTARLAFETHGSFNGTAVHNGVLYFKSLESILAMDDVGQFTRVSDGATSMLSIDGHLVILSWEGLLCIDRQGVRHRVTDTSLVLMGALGSTVYLYNESYQTSLPQGILAFEPSSLKLVQTAKIEDSFYAAFQLNGILYFESSNSALYKILPVKETYGEMVATTLTVHQSLCGGTLPGYPTQYSLAQLEGNKVGETPHYLLNDEELAQRVADFLARVTEQEGLEEVKTDNHYVQDGSYIQYVARWRNYQGKKALEHPSILQRVGNFREKHISAEKIIEYKNRLYVIANGRLHQLNEAQGTIEPIEPTQYTANAVVFNESLYLINSGGIAILDNEANRIAPFHEQGNFPTNTVIFNNTLFFYGTGVYYFDNTSLEVKPCEDLAGQYFMEALVAGGTLYLIGMDSIWYCKSVDDPFQKITTDRYFGTSKVANNLLFLHDYQQLYRMDSDGPVPLCEIHAGVQEIKYFNGRFYFATYEGLYLLNSDNLPTKLLEAYTPYSFLQIVGDTLYFMGGESNLLYAMREGETEFRKFATLPIEQSFSVGSTVFLNTADGLYFLDPATQSIKPSDIRNVRLLAHLGNKLYFTKSNPYDPKQEIHCIDLATAFDLTWKVATELEVSKSIKGQMQAGYPKVWGMKGTFGHIPSQATYPDRWYSELLDRSEDMLRFATRTEDHVVTASNEFIKYGELGDLRCYWDDYRRLQTADEDKLVPIYTVADLNGIRTAPAASYALMNDLDMDGYDAGDGNGWLPIPELRGRFYGNGFCIRNLVVKERAGSYYGSLFETIADGALVRDLCFEAANTQSEYYAGVLAGVSYGEIIGCRLLNCQTTVTRYNDGYGGGLVGASYGYIGHCEVRDCTVLSRQYRGGLIAGRAQGSIADCYAGGKVSLSLSWGGGIAGQLATCTVERCVARAEVQGGREVGLIGHLYAKAVVQNCVVLGGKITGASTNAARIGTKGAGYVNTIENCYASASVTITGGTVTSNRNEAHGETITDEQTRSQAFYEALGFDFDQSWKMGIQGEPVPNQAVQLRIPVTILSEVMVATTLYVVRHADGDTEADYERSYSLLDAFTEGGIEYPTIPITAYLQRGETEIEARKQALLRYVANQENVLAIAVGNSFSQIDKGMFEGEWKTYTPCHKLVVKTATTLDTKGFFHCAASLGDSLYLGNYADKGIVRIDTAGNVIPTNKTDGSFYCALPFDGKLYFGGADDIGVWYVDGADGQVKPTNLTEGLFHCMGAWEDTLYFGSFNNTGIWCMDKTEGKVAPTNVTEGYFSCIASDGHTLYFGSHHNKGIWMLDIDTGRIIPTNITTGDWLCAASSRSGQLYLGSGDNRGIVLLTEKGVFEATQLTSGSFQCAGSSSGTLYFGSNNDAGIWKMTSEGLFIATDKTDGSFFSAFELYGQLFFCSMDHSGVWVVDDTTGVPISTLLSDGNYHCLGVNGEVIYGGGYDEQLAALQLRTVTSGELVGTQLEVSNYRDGDLQAGWPRIYSLLDEFSEGGTSYPALSEAAYGQLSKQQQTQRADALLQFLAAQEGGDITVNNNLFIIDFNSIVMRGMIMMWTGSSAPEGWALCNGQNGTPDLRGRFVVGFDGGQDTARNYGAIGNKGGAAEVAITGRQMPKHRHFAQRVNGDDGANKNYYFCSNMQNAGDRSLTSADGMTVPSGAGGQTGISGNGEAHENRPPYYVLAYIMKL